VRKLADFLLLTICLSYTPLWGGEYAVLQNGFRIAALSHEIAGPVVLLKTSTGTMEIPAANIASFDQEEYVPPVPAAAKPQPTATTPEQPARQPGTALTAKELIDQAALRYGLRPEFVRSVAAAESAFQQGAVSPKGAIGLMQLMPGTAAALGANPNDAAQNADAGARYLRSLLLKYKDRPDAVQLALAAYNAGPGAVDRHHDIPPYRETVAYVERVLKNYLAQIKQ
jgi:soluble lytic murein transglycosylase-like protein